MLTIKRSISYLSWHRCISKSIFLGFIRISIQLSLPWFFYGVVLLKQSQGRTKLAHWCIAMVGNVTAISFYIVTTRQPLQQRTLDPDHDDVIKWKHFPRYWPFVRGIHRSPVNSPHKGQWRGALMFSLMCARINSWVNNREAGDLRRYRHHYDVIVMQTRVWVRQWRFTYTSQLLGSLLLTSFNIKLCMGKWLPSSL